MIKYRLFKPTDLQETGELIKGFYRETPGNSVISDKKIKKTFREFTVHPEKGAILVFESGKSLIGYAIVFRGWSNEHSKDIIFIDELYVKKEFRGKGAARGCIEYMIKKFKKNAVLLMLAVETGNEKVEKLYKKIGFRLYKNKTLFYEL